jgi:hypothetical protein
VRITLLALLLSFSPGFATAAPIHPLGDGDVPGNFTSGGVSNYVRGWRFVVNDDINVVEMGASTPHAQGDPFSVVLWGVSGQVKLAQLDFISDGTNNWQWADLGSPVALAAGSQYIVAVFSTVGNYYFGTVANPGPWAPTGTIQYLDMRYANSATSDTFPTNVLTNYQYGVPDIGYELAGVPEPSTLSMLGLGAGAFLLIRRRAASRWAALRGPQADTIQAQSIHVPRTCNDRHLRRATH